eukprot:552985-Prymnesium_polylepis.1
MMICCIVIGVTVGDGGSGAHDGSGDVVRSGTGCLGFLEHRGGVWLPGRAAGVRGLLGAATGVRRWSCMWRRCELLAQPEHLLEVDLALIEILLVRLYHEPGAGVGTESRKVPHRHHTLTQSALLVLTRVEKDDRRRRNLDANLVAAERH